MFIGRANPTAHRSLRRVCLPTVLPVALLGLSLALPQTAGAKPPTLDPTYGMPLPKARKASRAIESEAQWIWAEHVADTQTVLLRNAFTLTRVPKSALVYVTADNFFTLYINGQEVDHSEPDPKDGNVWQHVHQKDITRYLTPGRNAIALRAVNAGGAAGAIAQVEIGGKTVVATDAKWKVSEDLNPPTTWTSAAFDDSAWKTATVEAVLTGGPWNGGLQGWPGYDVDVPYLAHLTLPAVAVSDVHPGAGQSEGLTAPVETPGHFTVLPATTGSSDPPGLVVDFGKELAGRVAIRAREDVTVLVGTGESREEALKSPWGGVHTLDIPAGKRVYSPYSAFRYAHLVFLATGTARGPVPVEIAFDHKYYPVQYKGSFDCSDPLLTRIWYTGAYTAHLCMQEDIWDAPKRDRARWMGDLHVSGEVIDVAFADRFLMEQTMTRLRQDAQGSAPANELPHSHVNGIPGYSCAWIAGLADFHRHIGDYAYLNKQHDLLISMLEFFREELDDHSVFANKRKEWSYVDWSPGFNGDTPLARAATHMFLVKALHEGVFLLQEMGDTANANRYAAWADTLTSAAQSALLDPATHTFGDRRQENAMAIFSGVATPEQTQAIYDQVLKPGSPDWKVMATPYYNNYVIYAMSLAGHTTDTLNVLRNFWGGMLAEGATSWWEGYDPTWEKNDFHAHLQADDGTGYFVSLCHGWSAGPTSWLTDRVLGVRPTAGGFKTTDIVPDLGDLAWAEGNVPTPNGALHVRVEKQDTGTKVTINLPAGVEAHVGIPGAHATLNGHSVTPVGQENGRVYLVLRSAGKVTILGQP